MLLTLEHNEQADIQKANMAIKSPTSKILLGLTIDNKLKLMSILKIFVKKQAGN